MTVDVFNYFKNHPRFNKLIGNDYLFVEYKCPIDSEKFKLWTDVHFISYVVSGKKDWTSFDKTYTIEKGEALFIRKGIYNTKQYFENEYCVMLFFITDDFIRKFLKEHRNLIDNSDSENIENQIFKIDVSSSLNALFLSVFNYMNQRSTIPKDLVEMKFKELLFNIMLNQENKDLVDFFNSLKQVEKTNLNEIMLQNFHSDLKIDEFARLSGRSLSTFKRDFESFYRQSPGKWINNKRLEYARTLLQNPELNVNDVCYESGFKNASHFNNIFKEKYKYPPLQYRKLHFNQ